MDSFPSIHRVKVFYVCAYTFVVIQRLGMTATQYWQVVAGFDAATSFLFTRLTNYWLAYCLEASNRAPAKQNQRTNGPVNAHLISWPSKAQNIQNLENIW